MILLAALLALRGEDPTYADLSKKYGMGQADRLMGEAKYLEAAVAYRNCLLQSGEREAVRIPLALALLAKGEAGYAGIELRRAHMLYPDFARLRIDPAGLLGQKGTLARLAEEAARSPTEGEEAEVHAAIAYAWYLEGDRDRALASLGRYAQSRGEDAFARDLRAMISKDAKAPASVPPAAAPPSAPAKPKVRGGDPVRAALRFLETEPQPRGDIFSR